MSSMTATALTIAELSYAPRLRLVSSSETPAADPIANERPITIRDARPLQALDERSPDTRSVLVVAGQAARRTAVVEELAQTMPRSTNFVEADAFWEVLALASKSRMVIISGVLDDWPVESLKSMLAHRHPELPVVSLD
jgi:hypothetical protein